MDALRPILSRVIAPFITMFIAWLTLKWGIDLGSDAAVKLTDGAVVLLMALFTALNGLIHKFIDKYLNPADAATVALAAEGKLNDRSAKVRRR